MAMMSAMRVITHINSCRSGWLAGRRLFFPHQGGFFLKLGTPWKGQSSYLFVLPLNNYLSFLLCARNSSRHQGYKLQEFVLLSLQELTFQWREMGNREKTNGKDHFRRIYIVKCSMIDSSLFNPTHMTVFAPFTQMNSLSLSSNKFHFCQCQENIFSLSLPSPSFSFQLTFTEAWVKVLYNASSHLILTIAP